MKSLRIMVVLVPAVALMLGGCVSSGTYKQKEQETQQLGASLEENKRAFAGLQEKYDKLLAEHKELNTQADELGVKVKKLAGDLDAVKAENQKLAEAAKTENLLKAIAERIADLQQKVSKLQSENAALKKQLEKTDTAEAPQKTAPAKPASVDKEAPAKKDAVEAQPKASPVKPESPEKQKSETIPAKSL